jgi:hypothetical protein
MCVSGSLGGIFSSFERSHRFHGLRRASPGAVLWERGRNLRELTGCEAKKRGAKSSVQAALVIRSKNDGCSLLKAFLSL